MLDVVDKKILELLQENARRSNAEIAREIEMAPSATLERIRKLEERGVIEGYTVRLNANAMGYTTLAFVSVSSRDGGWCDDTFTQLAKIPEVLECHSVAGEDCFLVKVRAKDISHLNVILRDKIASMKQVINTRTTIVLESTKEHAVLPISQ